MPSGEHRQNNRLSDREIKMNQVAASILIVASSIFGYGAVVSGNEAAMMLGAASLLSGLCGVVALVAGLMHHRDLMVDNHARFDLMERMAIPESVGDFMTGRTDEGWTVRLPADIKAEVNYLADLRGQKREQILMEMLRRNLAKEKGRAA